MTAAAAAIPCQRYMAAHQSPPVSATIIFSTAAAVAGPSTPSSVLSPDISRQTYWGNCSLHDPTPALPVEPCPVDPLHHCCPSVTTPQTELPNDPGMNLLVGGALAPMPTSPRKPQQPAARPPRGLRLPSFDTLGIASPHPDRFGTLTFHDKMPAFLDGGSSAIRDVEHPRRPDQDLTDSFSTIALTPARVSEPAEPAHPKLAPGFVQTPFRHDVATLTPPADSGEPSWQPQRRSSLRMPLDLPNPGPAAISPSAESIHPPSRAQEASSSNPPAPPDSAGAKSPSPDESELA